MPQDMETGQVGQVGLVNVSQLFLTSPLYLHLLRKFVGMSVSIKFNVADLGQRKLALRLRAQVYAEDLGRVVEDEYDQKSHHLVASADGEIVAAVRVIGPEHRPFDCESIVAARGEELVLGPRPALIGRLCVRRDYRAASRSTAIHLGLLRLAVEFARQEQFSEYLLYTFPGLTRFYQSAAFVLTGIDFQHPHWGRLHVMRLDLSPSSSGRLNTTLRRSRTNNPS